MGGTRASEFRSFLETINAAVAGELELYLILDNYVPTMESRATRKGGYPPVRESAAGGKMR